MSANQETVISFLRDNGASEDIIQAVREETAGFSEIAESGTYPLLPAAA